MPIHNDLRALRQQCGLTQAQVAERLSLTRQAVSGYESGRTQPDVETLAKLCEIYGTDLDSLMFGAGKKLRTQKRLRIAAWALLGLVALLLLLWCIFYWSAGHFFPLPEGGVDPALAQAHFRLDNAAGAFERAALLCAGTGFLIIFILLQVRKARFPLRNKLRYVGVGAASMLLPETVFGLLDPVRHVNNYLFTPLHILFPMLLLLGLDLLIGIFRKRSASK